MDTAVQDICKYIEQRSGIKPDSISPGSWTRAIRRRMEATAQPTPRAYFQKLMSLNNELNELVELIVVPETWFFRDRPALDFLVSHIRNQEERARPRPWRILSLGCASGEEVYSIAMALYDGGIPLTRFVVEGMDISKKAIEFAKSGVYGPNSFRNKATLMHKRNFERLEDSLIVHARLRQRVKFFVVNITSLEFKVVKTKYDIIFCRNVLIYFSGQVQNRVFDTCENLLEEQGVLILGPTEREAGRLAGFVPVGPRNACAFLGRRLGALKHRLSLADAALSSLVSSAQKKPKPISNEASQACLYQAFRLADEGLIEESMARCNQYLESYEPTYEVYYLLGTLHLANNNDETAGNYLEKALYLFPEHYESLVNLALIAERQGKKQQAELYWRRARKQMSSVEDPSELPAGLT